MSERCPNPATPTSASASASTHRQRPPPDVEEALSSMLWTPYERTPTHSCSSDEDDDERLNRKLRKSQSSYDTVSASASALSSSSSRQLELPPPPTATSPPFVPFPTNFSLSACDAPFDLSKTAASHRYSYPYYYPHTLTQWCSTAAAVVKEPPSYESLYELGRDGAERAEGAERGSWRASALSRASVARTQPNVICDRSQRSPTPTTTTTATTATNDDNNINQLTAHVPTERLVRSFTDDYISQNCTSFKPAANNNNNNNQVEEDVAKQQQQEEEEKSSQLKHKAKATATTNARSQQSERNQNNNNNKANCIINEHGEEQEMTTTTKSKSESNEETSPVRVNQPVSCAAATATTLPTATPASISLQRSHCATATTKSEAAAITTIIAAIETSAQRESACSATTATPTSASTALSPSPASLSVESRAERSPVISLSSSFGARTSTDAFRSSLLSQSPSPSLSPLSSRHFTQLEFDNNNALRPNKCLAELERLYAEFRASESVFERGLGSESESESAAKMRLSVAATDAPMLPAEQQQRTVAAATQTASGSSVFLNNNNNNNISHQLVAGKSVSNISILPATKSCQKQPSLTIQVNNNNNNNSSSNGANNTTTITTTTGVEAATTTTASQSSIVNNNNGVCVVNCNYITATPNNNNNNNSVVEINSGKQKLSASVQNKQNQLNNNRSVIDNSVNIINVNTDNSNNNSNSNNNNNNESPRTFTSTECQTDDLATSAQLRTREQRRRERRERRQQQQQQLQLAPTQQQQRRHQHAERHSLPAAPPPPSHLHHPHPHPHPHSHPHSHPHPAAMGHHTGTLPAALMRSLLPDILHSHYPPPYSALPGGGGGGGAPQVQPQVSPQLPPQAPPLPLPPPPGATLLTPVISTVPLPLPGADGRFTLPLPLPIMRRSPSERSGKGCCGQWFAGPPLRALIAVVALGGVACALGGAALGATGLAGPPNSHLTAALLMIGVGVVLVTVSGAAWRMTAPGGQSCLGLGSSVDLGRCGRRPCSRGGGAPHGLLYPEFQHRPPPPSYQASMQEYRLRLLLLDRDRQNGVVRGNSPPPTYRSHAGSLLRAPLTTLRAGMGTTSSMGGSEYSLPPSYRSRNATPAIICGNAERTIETAPSGRLLANEDLPEPSLTEQLPDYSALQSNTLLTSAIVEIESSNRGHDNSNNNSNSGSPTAKTQAKDLVTIVTISQADSSQSAGTTRNGNAQGSAVDQIDILAHL